MTTSLSEPATHVEVLVEEPSMEAALRVLLPRILGDLAFEIYQHDSKAELLKRLPARLRGYASWLPANSRILVVIDRDDDNPDTLWGRLERIARQAGFGPRRALVINRLAIEELEAWYFGDWTAVHQAYSRVPANVPQQARYRRSDEVKGGTWEAFEQVLQRAGYFATGLRKIEAARAISTYMLPARNMSPSFGALRDALEGLAAA